MPRLSVFQGETSNTCNKGGPAGLQMPQRPE